MNLDTLLGQAMEKGASDLHLAVRTGKRQGIFKIYHR